MTPKMLGGLLGIPMTAFTQVPAMVRGGAERDNLRKIQQSGGAGAQAARQSADQAARDAASVAGGGNSASRGLNLLTGLRAGERSRQAGTEQASRVAASEAARATSQLRDNDIARRASIGKVGAAAGGTLAAFQAQQMAADDATFKAEQAQQNREAQLEMARIMAGVQSTPETPGGVAAIQEATAAQEAANAGLQERGEAIGSTGLSQAAEAPAEGPDLAELEYLEALRDPNVRLARAGGMAVEEALNEFFPGLYEKLGIARGKL